VWAAIRAGWRHGYTAEADHIIISGLDGAGIADDYTAIFALTRERPVIDHPIERGGKIYVIGLVERTEKKSEDKPAPGPGLFFDEWMAKLSVAAKVQDYVEKQQ